MDARVDVAKASYEGGFAAGATTIIGIVIALLLAKVLFTGKN